VVVMEETAVSVDGPKVTKKRKDFWVEDAEGSVVVNPCSTKWIQFRAARNQYEIHYQDHAGVIRRSVKNLTLDRRGKKGRQFTADENSAQMKIKYEAARTVWNELDQSPQARFPAL